MKTYDICAKKFVLGVLSCALSLSFFTPTAFSAPNQERLDRKPQAVHATEQVSPDDMSQMEKTIQKKGKNHIRSERKNKKKAYSDRSYLSAALAQEKLAVSMAKNVIAEDDTPEKIEKWARAVLRASERRIDIARTLLADMGGADKDVYQRAESSLLAQTKAVKGHSITTDFLIFLLSYCRSSMENAIPALVESDSADIIEMSERVLDSQSSLAAAVRIWLQNKHFKSDA